MITQRGAARVDGSYILVVDDDADVRDALQSVLEGQDYRVRTAVDGERALSTLKEEPASLVLLDLMMPVMNGAEALRRIREDAQLRGVPVVVVSAWDREAALVEGAQGTLRKPVDLDSLLAAVSRFVPPQKL